MKKYFFILSGIILNSSLNAQTVIPQTIPCLTVTQTNLPGLGSGIEAIDCIETDGNVTFLQYENYSIKAGEYISFGQNTVINPDASHQFHAYIDNGGMDVAWYYPNATPGTVGLYEKLELGARFQDNIETFIQNFNNETGTTQINPFDPSQLDLKAEFWYYSTLVGDWVGPQQVYGFYYEEYERNTSGTYPDGQWIIDGDNAHKFRIRFAPRAVGLWKCKISATIPGYGNFETSPFTFECVNSDNLGFMRVGDNKRYFRRGTEPFFPVGHNLSWPRNEAYGWDVGFHPITPAPVFEDYHEQLEELKSNGANYLRFINSPWATDIEFEKLGDYSDRMRHAWEMDQIVLKAEELDLLIHWNLDIGSAFTNRGVVSSYWDWTSENDPHAGTVPCALPPGLDNGYCYHAEIPECVNPVDFLTSETARTHYKNKLRYLIARYAYSTSVGMIELFSEVNHFGKEFVIDFDTELDKCVDNTVYQPYNNNPSDVCPKIYEWQAIMTEHIQAMNIYEHPVAVSYAPEPDFDHGDYSYGLSSVDVASWNLYQTDINKYNSDFAQTTTWQSFLGLDKPVIHSEFGAFGFTGSCDNGSQFRQTLCLTPFIGSACSMNWDWQYPGETELWPQIGIVNDLLQGIPLDEENWSAAFPLFFEDERIEVYYLQRPKIDGYRKAVGAISNRTYNLYTQGDIGSQCKEDSSSIPLLKYQMAVDFPYMGLDEPIKIPDMGFSKDYRVDWINAFTGELLTSTYPSTTLLSQNLELAYPVTLDGNATGAILFFQVYPLGETFKSAEVTDESSDSETSLLTKKELDSLKITDWSNLAFDVFVSPNPSSGITAVTIRSNYAQCNWYLCDASGQLLLSGQTDKSFFELDLSALSPGFYTLICESDEKRVTKKISKT